MEAFVKSHSDHGGADVVLEAAGAENTFEMAWKCARPNAIVTVVALYDRRGGRLRLRGHFKAD